MIIHPKRIISFIDNRIVLLSLVLALCLASPAAAEKVRYVVDGDTVILESNQHVRLIGIDAPEVSHREYGKKGESFGKASRRYLHSLVEGKDVQLRDGEERFDRFGRRLAYLYLPDGTFVNREMVAEGYAEVMRKFPFAYKEEFFQVEREARTAKRGMWAERRGGWQRSLADFFERLLG